MREILFRGKRLDTKKWITESETFIRDGDGIWLSTSEKEVVKIDQKTIGQFTGLTDKNGKEIYEGDIVRILYTDWPSKSDSEKRTLDDYLDSISHIMRVSWDSNSAGWGLREEVVGDESSWTHSIHSAPHGRIKVIGNIYENENLIP